MIRYTDEFPVVSGRKQRDVYNGATKEGDDYIHLGIVDPFGGSRLVCGGMWKAIMMTYSDVEITCPECAKVIEAKIGCADHPQRKERE